eukprot:1767522-Amphidinium_carterae.1
MLPSFVLLNPAGPGSWETAFQSMMRPSARCPPIGPDFQQSTTQHARAARSSHLSVLMRLHESSPIQGSPEGFTSLVFGVLLTTFHTSSKQHVEALYSPYHNLPSRGRRDKEKPPTNALEATGSGEDLLIQCSMCKQASCRG